MKKGRLASLATTTISLVVVLVPIVFVVCIIIYNFSVVVALFAAIATFFAAREAAKSANIAKDSMERSEELAKITIEETQRFNRRNSFESRYALLLKQHDVYHHQVCEYMDKKDDNDSIENKITPHIFFTKHYHSGSIEHCLAFLTGHEIISRYMRTLYHLLKYVRDEFYVYEEPANLLEMKRYTSPLRSTIRNDVLCLIAVNALNICSDSARKSGYPRYQQLLHDFGFFEHAVFHSPIEPNKIFDDVERPEQIQKHILETQSCFWTEMETAEERREFYMPNIRLFSPLILCLLSYENPMKKITAQAMESLYKDYTKKITSILERYKETYDNEKEKITKWSQWHYRESKHGGVKKCTDNLLDKIRSSSYASYAEYEFYDPSVEDMMIQAPVYGGTISRTFEKIIRYEKIANDIVSCGGIDNFIKNSNSKYTDTLKRFLKDIEQYDVRNTQPENSIDTTKKDAKL